MPIVLENTQRTQKPDVYDVLVGEYDAAKEPVFNRLIKGPDVPDAKLFQFPFDVPDDPTNEGAPEGVDFSQSDAEILGGRDLLYGRCHHDNQFFGVGEISQGNQVYATNGEDEFTYQMKRALRRMMKNAELTVIGNQEAQAGNGSSDFRTRGAELWINFNVTGQTDTQTVCPAAFRTPTAQVVNLAVTGDDYPLAEDDISVVFESLFNTLKGNMDLDVFCTTKFKKKVSGWGNLVDVDTDQVSVRRFNIDADEHKIVAKIDTWQGDAGTARFQLHPWLRFNTTNQKAEALGLDFKYLSLRVRQAPKAVELPKAGGGRRGQASQTYGLRCVPKFLAKWKRSA